MKNRKPLKKVSEKDRLQQLHKQLVLQQKSAEERISHYGDLVARRSSKDPVELEKRSRKLEEARSTLEETLVLLESVTIRLEQL